MTVPIQLPTIYLMRDIAEELKVKLDTVHTYRGRGLLPDPDGYIERTPYWFEETISSWLAERESVEVLEA